MARYFDGLRFQFEGQEQYKFSAKERAKKLRNKGFLVRIAELPKMMSTDKRHHDYALWIAKEKEDRYGRKYPRRYKR